MKHFRPKKSLGQNFLNNDFYINKIIQSIPKDKNIIEIGAGLGNLTQALLSFGKLISFEIDKRAYLFLKAKFKEQIAQDKLEIINGDILDYLNISFMQDKYIVVANLPYYIASNIVLSLLKDSFCTEMIVMLQKEVAYKFCAKVGDKDFCALSVIAQMIGVSKVLFCVPPVAFNPVPKVDSAVIHIKKTNSFYEDNWGDFLRKAFMHRRRKLLGNLSNAYKGIDFEKIFLHINIDEQIRPHQLDSKLYYELYKAKNKH